MVVGVVEVVAFVGGKNDTKMHLYYSGLVCCPISTQVCTANNSNINVFAKNGQCNNLKPFS